MNQVLNVLTGVLVMMTRFDIDGSKGASCWLMTDPDDENDDVLGKQLIKITMSYSMFDAQKTRILANEFNLPCECRVSYSVVMGGGNKPKLKAVDFTPVILNKSVKDIKLDIPK